jgi:hypothetical protein
VSQSDYLFETGTRPHKEAAKCDRDSRYNASLILRTFRATADEARRGVGAAVVPSAMWFRLLLVNVT